MILPTVLLVVLQGSAYHNETGNPQLKEESLDLRLCRSFRHAVRFDHRESRIEIVLWHRLLAEVTGFGSLEAANHDIQVPLPQPEEHLSRPNWDCLFQALQLELVHKLQSALGSSSYQHKTSI